MVSLSDMIAVSRITILSSMSSVSSKFSSIEAIFANKLLIDV